MVAVHPDTQMVEPMVDCVTSGLNTPGVQSKSAFPATIVHRAAAAASAAPGSPTVRPAVINRDPTSAPHFPPLHIRSPRARLRLTSTDRGAFSGTGHKPP